MKSSPRRGVDVFNFDEDDGVHDFLAGKYSGKLRSPSLEDHALPNRNSPECDVDVADCNPSCGNTTFHASLGEAEMKAVSTNDCGGESHQEHSEFKFSEDVARKIVPDNLIASEQFKLNSDSLDSSSECEPIDVTSDIDESATRSYSSSPASETAEDNDLLNGSGLDHCSGDMETDDMPMTVVLYPDYITYRDNYYTEPCVIFTDSCIKILRSNEFENHEAFDFEWGCDDVVTITSQIFQRVETVMIKLGVLSKDTYKNVHQTAGIDDVKIFVVEPNWHRIQEEITSLNQRYNSVWVGADDVDVGVGTDGENTPGMTHYFPVFEDSFEDVVYPKGEADAVSISKRDVDLLQPETFINDTIIDFYIKYLKNQIGPEERHKFHFFNSFFFRKLADMDKDPSQASDGAAAFQRVRKWTRKVDLFEKEFVFIPVNFSLHWSLIVICHPGEAATSADENLDESVKLPCILHMDSIKGNHTGLKHLMQSYLLEEWKERKKETSEEVSSKFYNLRFVALELPQQENSFDCGLFLLHYLERFLAEVPDTFNPFKIERESSFLNSYWFPPTEASLKRVLIQRLISELLKNHSQEVSSSASSDDDQIIDNNVNGNGSHFLSARFDPGPSCQQNKLLSSEAGHGIELTLLSASSMRSSQCINDSGLVLRNLLNPGDSIMGECQSFDQKSSKYRLNGPISPLEADPETGEQFMFGENEFHQLQMTIPNSQTGTILYPLKESGGEAIGSIITLQTEHRVIDGPSEPSIRASDAPLNIATTEAVTVIEHSSLIQKDRIDEPRILSVEHIECIEGHVSPSHESPDTPAAAEAFQNRGNVQSGNVNEFGFPTLLEYHEFQHDVMAGKGIDVSEDVQMIDDDDKVDSNLQEQQPLDDRISSGDNALNVDGGFVGPVSSGGIVVEVLESLVSLGIQPVENGIGSGEDQQNINDGFVGPIDSARNEVKVLEGVVSLGVQLVENGVGSGDDAQFVVELPAVSDLPREQPLSTATGSADHTQILVKDDSVVGLESAEQKLVDVVAVDSVQNFEGSSSGLDSPGQQAVDNLRGLCKNSEIFADALVGLDSSKQRAVENVDGGSGDNNSQAFEDALVGLDSSKQRAVENVDGGSVDNNSQAFEVALVGPESSEQIAVANVDGSPGDNSRLFEHALVGPDSSDQRAVENVDGVSGDNNSQVFEDASADLNPLVESKVIADHNVETAKSNLPAPNSHDQELEENRPDSNDGARTEEVALVTPQIITVLGDNVEMQEAGSNRREPAENDSIELRSNEQILETNLVVQVSPQSKDKDVPTMNRNSVAPDSPSQHRAKRPRLLPSQARQV